MHENSNPTYKGVHSNAQDHRGCPPIPADQDVVDSPTKRKYNVYLDEDVVKEAKELGLNISKISENALIMYIKALKKSGVTSPSK